MGVLKLSCKLLRRLIPKRESPWGKMISIDMHGCNKDLVKDEEFIHHWIQKIVRKIEMTSWGDPIVVRMENENLIKARKEGITAIQLLTTSSITIHFCDDGKTFLDLFSCREFDSKMIVRECKETFHPEYIKNRTIKRK